MKITLRATLLLTLAFLILALTSCADVRTEKSEVLHEDATIQSAVYTPSVHSTQITPSAFKSKAGHTAVDLDGNEGVSIGRGLQVTSSTVPEKHAIVFDCQHGQFVITRKELYEKLKGSIGKKVDVTYQEIYRVTREKTDKGEKIVTERVLTGYDFLNASVKTN